MPDRRTFLIAAPALASGFAGSAAAEGCLRGVVQKDFTGKVVPLKDLLAKAEIALDKDADPFWLALATADGCVYPLIKDPGSRRFFKDERLRNRDVRINGKLFGNTCLLQVMSMVGLKNGKPTEIYYWCDICAIKRHELMICECCGGAMELREETK